MSRKHDDESDASDEEEEDEGDFVPGMDDDDDLDDDFEEENLAEDEDDSFLKGHIYLSDGKITFDGESFALISEETVSSFSLSEPALEKPAMFSGTLKDIALKMEVSITKNDQAAKIDPLEQRFLDQQAQVQSSLETAGPSDSRGSASAKAGDDEDDMDDMKKTASAVSTGDEKKAAVMGDVYVFEACQIGYANGTTHKIRGIFHPLHASSKATRIFLIAFVQTNQASAAASSAASPAKPAAATTSRKRGRNDEEDEDDGDDRVGYQELIDLHDDAGLSTEELRRRYYGGDTGESEAKIHKARPTSEESDDDDAYGF
jgi:hypothetical protein